MGTDRFKKILRLPCSLIADFCNKIGTFQTSTDVRYTAAFAGNPDIEQTSPNDRVWIHNRRKAEAFVAEKVRFRRNNWGSMPVLA
jgi:hypothetical protein